mgnify:CR=1 FL=1
MVTLDINRIIKIDSYYKKVYISTLLHVKNRGIMNNPLTRYSSTASERGDTTNPCNIVKGTRERHQTVRYDPSSQSTPLANNGHTQGRPLDSTHSTAR